MRLSRRFSTREQYNKYDVAIGTLSTVPKDTFALKWKEIDEDNNQKRCRRYGYTYDPSKQRNRRLFYGSLIANEPWELFEITSAEAFGIYNAMAFIESNRTQSFMHRPFQRLDHGPLLQIFLALSQLK